MIQANATIEDLERDYSLRVKAGKTLKVVDGKRQWVNVTTFCADVLGVRLEAASEVLSEFVTPELLATEKARMINALKVEILKREDEYNG